MTVRVLVGDVRHRIRDLADGSIRCCVTSPPYWGLRDYGVDSQIGLEKTPQEYIDEMVGVFSEVRRVLSDDGTVWLNLGDCYATGGGKVGRHHGGGEQGARWVGRAFAGPDDSAESDADRGSRGGRGGHEGKHKYLGSVGPMTQPNRMPIEGLKPKDLVMMPARVAIALQADGWWLRSDIIWAKPNPMPESVTDRPTKSHEYVFLLSKSEQYYYDAEAIAEPSGGWKGSEFDDGKNAIVHPNVGKRRSGNKERKPGSARGCPENTGSNVCGSVPWEGSTRNARSVWTITPKPFKGAHFATMPAELAERCILAGSAKGDTVLDPFGGAGTTGLVAHRLGRSATLIELNPEYAALAERRIRDDAPLFAEVAV